MGVLQMVSFSSILLVVCYHLLLTQTVSCFTANANCIEIRNYTISSSGSNSPDCFASNSRTPCQSIDYLFEHVQNTSCMMVTILNSLELKSSGLIVTSANELTIVGDLSSQIYITCHNKSGGILFTSSHNIHLENLHFVSCGMEQPYSNPDIYPLVDHAAVYFNKGSDIVIEGCTFSNSSGTGVIMNDVNGANLLENTNFTGNKPMPGAVHDGSTNSTFGGLIIKRKDILGEANFTLEGCFFTENENLQGSENVGGGFTLYLGSLNSNSHVVISKSHYISNKANQGAGVYIYQSGTNSTVFVDISLSTFVRNHGILQGGGLLLEQNKANLTMNFDRSTFFNNSAMWGGGLAVFNHDNQGKIIVTADSTVWCANNADLGGFGIGFSVNYMNRVRYSNLTRPYVSIESYFNHCQFNSNVNVGYYHNMGSVGAVYLEGSKAEFDNAMFVNNTGSALSMLHSAYAAFSGNTSFVGNVGFYGAAINVDQYSVIALRDGVFLNFHNNSAALDGGAIYTEYYSLNNGDDVCVFESLNSLLHSSGSYHVNFSFNMARYKDTQSIFVGQAGNCLVNGSRHNIILFDSKIFSYEPPVPTQIASTAAFIHLDTHPPKIGDYTEVMLGEYFYLVPNVTDIFGNNASLAGNLVLFTKGVLNRGESELVGPNYINMDSYTRNSRLYISGTDSIIGKDNLYLDFIYHQQTSFHDGHVEVSIKIVDCKPGFVYNESSSVSEQICKCTEKDEVLICPSSRSHACIRYGYWYGDYNQTDGKVLPCSGKNCFYADGNCPKSECPDSGSPGFCLLSDSDDLCWKGNGGLLCSECRENYSFTFSGLNCVPSSTCTRGHTALITLGLIVYWILITILVLFVLSLNLSMGAGFMYGIVYYFSILSFFTDGTVTGSFLQAVINTGIAMTQLRPRAFGDISVCFVENWDLNLHHTFFHYLTPVFVISTIVFIMWISRCCQLPRRISLAHNSPIHAICMLVLFSYTSVAYTSFILLKPIKIKGEWRVYMDPKIGYFHNEHLPYALIAILLELFVLLPICFLLLFAPCLSGRVNLVKLRLKPILDDFQACYRPECRWFAGFYYLARQLMFLAHLIPQDSLSNSNYFLRCTAALILIVHSSFQPYKLKWLNMFDTILLIDLFILSFFDLEWTTSIPRRALPYILILVPSVYLYTVIILVIVKRFFISFRGLKFFEKFKARRNTTELPSAISTTTSIGFEDDKIAASEQNARGVNFFKDYGEREPLLSENDSEHPPPTVGGGSHSFTTSSLRLSVKNRLTSLSKKFSTT